MRGQVLPDDCDTFFTGVGYEEMEKNIYELVGSSMKKYTTINTGIKFKQRRV